MPMMMDLKQAKNLTTTKDLLADLADQADKADLADLADQADKADLADQADQADLADLADQAAQADQADLEDMVVDPVVAVDLLAVEVETPAILIIVGLMPRNQRWED